MKPIANDPRLEDSMSTQPTATNPTPTETHQVKLILEGQAGELLSWLQSVMAAMQVHQKGPPGRRGPRLTPEQAAATKRRAAAGESRAALAREFGISTTSASHIVTGKTWRDCPTPQNTVPSVAPDSSKLGEQAETP